MTGCRGACARVAFLAALVERSAALAIMLVQVLVLSAGAYMAASGLISVGTLAAFLALFLNASLSLAYATQYIPTLVNAVGGMERIDEVLSLEPGVKDRPDAVDLPLLEQGIELKSVLFGYDEKTPNLRDVSLSLPADASIAIVGPSGSGKSTILGLLMRLYEPHAGQITFDGIDVRSASLKSLRRQIGVVFQDSFLFDTTIRENIRLGRLDATPAEIEAAAKEAEYPRRHRCPPRRVRHRRGGARRSPVGRTAPEGGHGARDPTRSARPRP